MAKSGKKQGEKKQPQTKRANAAKVSDASKKTKQPASFSKSAPKEKVEKKVETTEEFETMKLATPKKAPSKIILRDVTRDNLDIKLPETKKVGQPTVQPTAAPKKKDILVPAPKLSAKQIKEQEIEKAIKSATKIPATNTNRRQRKSFFGDFGLARAILATACAATVIFAIVYFVNLTSADMSLKVAAMQSGIDASYPSYVPRGYDLSDVISSNGKITIHFKNGDDKFELTEETSNWDSEALLNGFVKEKYENSYTVVREQGLTLYMGDDWEAWVNGGTLYKLSVTSGSLTKKQMKSIATSL